MTVPFYCMIAAFTLNYLSKAPVAFAMIQSGGYDNNNPRRQQSKLAGFGERATAGHMNSFEITPIFAAAVITCHMFALGHAGVEIAALIFVFSRVVYHVLYMVNWSLARSFVWALGTGCVVWMFGIAASA